MRNCFVPLCDAKNKNTGKRMMFLPPKDENTFKIWVETLPKKRPFKKIDRVCEHHFDESDIIKTWDHIINGKLHRLDRGKPKLKSNAVPKHNLPQDIYYLRKGYNPVKKPKKIKHAEINNEEEIQQEIPIKNSIEVNKTPVDVKNNIYIEEPHDEVVITSIQNPLEIRAEEDLEMCVSELNEEFEMLYDEVFEVTLPSTLWAIQRDPEKNFIVFSCFDQKCMGNIKTLFLDNKNNSKFYIRQKCVVNEKNEIFTTDHINSLLDDFESYKVCAGIYSKDYNTCDGLVGADEAYCNSCREISFE